MSMRVSGIEGLKFKTEYRGLEVISDIDGDYEPEGMSPSALMMVALGTCVGSRLVDQMNKRGREVGDVEVTVKLRANMELRIASLFARAQSCLHFIPLVLMKN